MNNEQNQGRKGSGAGILVPLIILVGALAGVLTFAIIAREFAYFPPFQGELIGFETYLAFHIILSTVGISLLVALVVVYGRTYAQTKANFALGLLFVLVALLFQQVLTYPLFSGFVEGTRLELGFSSPVADMFTIVAYAVFLYLSLE